MIRLTLYQKGKSFPKHCPNSAPCRRYTYQTAISITSSASTAPDRSEALRVVCIVAARRCRTAPSETQISSSIWYEVIIVLLVSISLLTLTQRYPYIYLVIVTISPLFSLRLSYYRLSTRNRIYGSVLVRCDYDTHHPLTQC